MALGSQLDHLVLQIAKLCVQNLCSSYFLAQSVDASAISISYHQFIIGRSLC